MEERFPTKWMRRSGGGPRPTRRLFLHCRTVDRGHPRFKARRKIAPFLATRFLPREIPLFPPFDALAMALTSLPFRYPVFSSLTFAVQTSPRGSFFVLFLSLKKKTEIFYFWSERKKGEREREGEKNKKRDAGLYLSISGDRSVRGLDLRLDGCCQKCGLVYRRCYTRWRRSGDGFWR